MKQIPTISMINLDTESLIIKNTIKARIAVIISKTKSTIFSAFLLHVLIKINSATLKR